MNDASVQELLAKSLHFLSFRSRTQKELKEYLAKRSGDAAIVDKVLAKLIDMELINDDDFAKELIDVKLKKGYGPKKIYFDLLNKGVDKIIAKRALASVEENEWKAVAYNVLTKKRIDISDTKAVYACLYTRGFEAKNIKKVIDDSEYPE